MPLSTKLDDKLEGVSHFKAWKYRVNLILEENKLLKLIQSEQPEPQAAEAKEEHQMQLIRAKRIIVDSIRDHLIPIVSSRKTPKEMYDALSRPFEGRTLIER